MAPACRHCGQPHDAYLTVCPVTGGRLGSATYTLVNDDEALVGTVVAERYHIRDILGQGSTGTVFGAIHMHFDRPSAMKVLRPRYTMLDTVQRVFHGETRAALSVQHPSLAEVFDIGTLPDGAPFFVMERLEGDTLASRLGRERFSIAAAVDLMMQLLSAMEALHARDVLLRDLRPQNIFLTHRRGCRPVLKILDVGLSRLIPLERIQGEWDALRAVVGVHDGSGSLSIPYYLSPERTRGDHGIEPTSDIFVAAMIFYEALTGQKPFNASTFHGLLSLIAQAQPPPLAPLRPDIPEDLSALVMRALSQNPRSRPASAKEMQDELRAAFEGPRRGSAQMRVAPVAAAAAPAAPAADSSVHTPHVQTDRDQSEKLTPFHGYAGSAPAPRPAAGQRFDQTINYESAPLTAVAAEPRDEYQEDTSTDTDRKSVLEPTLNVRVNAVDEASADHPIRTVRPGPNVGGEIDVDVDMGALYQDDPTTSRGGDLTAALGLTPRRRGDEEDETETMQLTPELRARIEQMTKSSPSAPASATEDSNRPPPTRRLTKPQG